MELQSKTFSFEASHILSWHKGVCKNLHGHTYKFTVMVRGEVDENGTVIDFGDLHKYCKYIVTDLDHTHLNDRIPNPTCENIVRVIVEKFKIYLWGNKNINCIQISLQEGDGGTATLFHSYRRDL